MNKIIPFKKDISFLNDIYEIISISLEHNYAVNNNNINGEFVISGEYSTDILNKEPFIYNIPFDIDLDSNYDNEKVKVDIDDFNYLIKSNNILEININLKISNLIVKEEIEEVDEIEEIEEEKDERNIEDVKSIFNNFDDKDDKYITYNIHILRENDDLNKIMEDYKISKEELSLYNDLDKITIGSKIIIPNE